MPIDPDTYLRLETALRKAKQHGIVVGEVLDRDRLLLTRARERDIKVTALQELYIRLEKQSPGKLLRFYAHQESGTAAEMFEAIVHWIDAVIRAVAEDRLQEVDDQANQQFP